MLRKFVFFSSITLSHNFFSFSFFPLFFAKLKKTGGNWMMAAGFSGNRINVFNIAKQSMDYDPEGKYVLHHLPELQGLRNLQVGGAKIHDPRSGPPGWCWARTTRCRSRRCRRRTRAPTGAAAAGLEGDEEEEEAGEAAEVVVAAAVAAATVVEARGGEEAARTRASAGFATEGRGPRPTAGSRAGPWGEKEREGKRSGRRQRKHFLKKRETKEEEKKKSYHTSLLSFFFTSSP